MQARVSTAGFRLSRGMWLYQASVWPTVRSHCVLPEPRLCLRAGEGGMPPLVRVAVEGSQAVHSQAEFSECWEYLEKSRVSGLSSGCLLSQMKLWPQAQWVIG